MRAGTLIIDAINEKIARGQKAASFGVPNDFPFSPGDGRFFSFSLPGSQWSVRLDDSGVHVTQDHSRFFFSWTDLPIPINKEGVSLRDKYDRELKNVIIHFPLADTGPWQFFSCPIGFGLALLSIMLSIRELRTSD
jgi:hypothetical protein